MMAYRKTEEHALIRRRHHRKKGVSIIQGLDLWIYSKLIIADLPGATLEPQSFCNNN
jgi:hypothetical protein